MFATHDDVMAITQVINIEPHHDAQTFRAGMRRNTSAGHPDATQILFNVKNRIAIV
jgi:hypothetical protein